MSYLIKYFEEVMDDFHETNFEFTNIKFKSE